ncbi:MAG: type II toxin-antitoxin system RelE/ParE family toxin [Candidatus Shapirobacteria bacterium]
MDYELFVLDKREFEKFLGKLDKESQIRISRDISFLKEYGSMLKMPFAKKIHNKLYELRTSGKQKIRLIYTINGLQIYLIHWFVKKTKKLPIQDLKTALKRLTLI